MLAHAAPCLALGGILLCGGCSSEPETPPAENSPQHASQQPAKPATNAANRPALPNKNAVPNNSGDNNSGSNSTGNNSGTNRQQPNLSAVTPSESPLFGSGKTSGAASKTDGDAGDGSLAPPDQKQIAYWNNAETFAADGAKRGYFPLREFPAEVLQQLGIRHISGPRLELYTDIAPSPALDELPHVFELAHAAWCAYFELDAQQDSAWRMNGFIMADRQKFLDSGLLPAEIPAFDNGYTRDFEFWMDEKSTDYYRRHLALHEGTHGFMLTHISGTYPEWFFEGIAELLGTHTYRDGKLTLGVYPGNVDDFAKLGRIELLRQGFRAGRMFSWGQLMTQGLHRREIPEDADPTEYYAWTWGWCAMMDGIESYVPRFRKLHELRNEPDFTTAMARQFVDQWPLINDNWQLFVSEVEYGYDFARNVIVFMPGSELPPEGKQLEVDSARGWQSTGITLTAGKRYEIKATGRYVMHRDNTRQPPTIWQSEPQGIAVEYYNGRPIGTLEGVIVAEDRDPSALSPFLNTVTVGTGGTETANSTGTLYLRINDHPANRGDNSGTAKVSVKEVVE